MSLKYKVGLISIERKDELMKRYSKRILYEERADIYGCCVKLLTDIKYVKERWEENFYPMSAHVRSHGRLVVVKERDKDLEVLYDPLSKTAFLINVDYYGWIKSIALSVAGDILEDEHGIYSVHGACIDVEGQGIGLIAPPGTGKTTHTYGLLRLRSVRAVADDWFFVRLFGEDAIAFGSEKNFYIQADIAEIWGEYKELVKNAEFDEEGRAIVNVRWIVGKGRIIPLTTLRKVILLKRDSSDQTLVRNLETGEAVQYVLNTDFCNPHLLVRDERKRKLRKDFFEEFFSRVKLYLINAVQPPTKTHDLIRETIESAKGSRVINKTPKTVKS
ncbi:MAG: aldolase [Candidatus Geothermarchaeales archaeon]